jgi:hypothetical protein
MVTPDSPHKPPSKIRVCPAATDRPWRLLFDWLLAPPSDEVEKLAEEQLNVEHQDDHEKTAGSGD